MQLAISRILEKLQVLRDRGYIDFGHKRHQLRLSPPLAEERIAGFEQAHGVRLPEEFRGFLLHAGGSGAGPDYGLRPMDEWLQHLSEDNLVALPCPLRPGMFEDQAVDGRELSEEFMHGTIFLVHGGCDYATLLIVTGEFRGRLVDVHFETSVSPRFCGDDHFLGWYERWLDACLAPHRWVLQSRDPAALLATLHSPSSAAVERHTALRNALQLPQLDEQMLAAVRACLADPASEVVSASLDIFEKLGLVPSSQELIPLCASPSPGIRCIALGTLRKVDETRWQHFAREALRDGELEVVYRALCLLLDAKALTQPDLLPLIASPEAAVRRYAIWAWGWAPFKLSDAPWLQARIHDLDREVRRQVIESAWDANDAAFFPHLKRMAARENGEFDTLVAKVARKLRPSFLRRVFCSF